LLSLLALVPLALLAAWWLLRPGPLQDGSQPDEEKDGPAIAPLPAERRRPWHPRELVAVLGDDHWRHWASITDIAADAAGKRVASRGRDNHVRIWDAASGRPIVALPAEAAAGTGLAFSSSGDVVAIGIEGGGIWLWQGPNWERRKVVRHKGDVLALAFRPNSSVLATGDSDGVVRWGDFDHGAGKLSEYRCPGAVVRSLLCGEDGSLVVGDSKGIIHFIGPPPGKPRTIDTGHGQVFSLAFAPGYRLVSAHDDGHVCLWDLKTGKHAPNGARHEGPAEAVAVSPDGKWLASAGWDYSFFVYDARSGEKQGSGQLEPQRLNALAWLSGAEPTLLVAGEAGHITAWSPSTRKRLHADAGHYGQVKGLAWLPSGELASGAEDRHLRFWSLAAGKSRAFPSRLRGHCHALAVCDGLLAAGGMGDTVRLFDPATGQQRGALSNGYPARALAPLSGGRLVIGGESRKMKAEVWDVRQQKRTQHWLAHEPDCWALAVEGERLALGDGTWEGEGHVRLFNPDFSPAGSYGGHTHAVHALAFHSGRLASGDNAGQVFLDGKPWGKKLSGGVSALVWSADGSRLAVATIRGEVEWRDAEGKRVINWEFPGGVKALALTADDRHLLTGNDDGTIFVLRLP
jgi:WD40 repeat protein